MELREASLEWISLTLQKSYPALSLVEAQDLATALLDLAEEYDVQVEVLRTWIQTRASTDEPVTARHFKGWIREEWLWQNSA